MFINGNEINFAHVAPSAHDVDPKTLKLPSVKSMFKKSDRIMKTTNEQVLLTTPGFSYEHYVTVSSTHYYQ